MVELIPRRVLFGKPEWFSPSPAPDATRLAWTAPRDGALNVRVAPVSAAGADLQDRGGDENWSLYAPQ
jgi:hypothetical protein